ncbi:hypothetical protein KM1_118700, partial [Entamoeba histolytica HM-3:IMSS]
LFSSFDTLFIKPYLACTLLFTLLL